MWKRDIFSATGQKLMPPSRLSALERIGPASAISVAVAKKLQQLSCFLARTCLDFSLVFIAASVGFLLVLMSHNDTVFHVRSARNLYLAPSRI